MDSSIRSAAVAGAFYPGTKEALEDALTTLIPQEDPQHELVVCISPHAGFLYSGSVAGRLFAHLDLPRRVIVLGPNHTGAGAEIAVASHRSWATPLGAQPVDIELAERLVEAFHGAELDTKAHWREHSIELQLPFLMRRRRDLLILPVCLKQLSLSKCVDFGAVLADLVGGLGEPVGIVVSSDMTHYRPDEVARAQDRLAIDAVLERDPKRLFETVFGEGISMCGIIPATVALAAANKLGATGAHLVAYATSGEVTGDAAAVVGYAGICIHR